MSGAHLTSWPVEDNYGSYVQVRCVGFLPNQLNNTTPKCQILCCAVLPYAQRKPSLSISVQICQIWAWERLTTPSVSPSPSLILVFYVYAHYYSFFISLEYVFGSVRSIVHLRPPQLCVILWPCPSFSYKKGSPLRATPVLAGWPDSRLQPIPFPKGLV
jgi:hypothetical protein